MGFLVLVILVVGVVVAFVCTNENRGTTTEQPPLYSKYEPEALAKSNEILIMTVWNKLPSGGEKLQFYYDGNNNYTLVDRTRKCAYRDAFRFKVMDMKNDTYVYHPEQLVYTGATVGNIHTGGFHTEKAYYSQRSYASGRGVIYCDYNENLPYFLAARIKLNDELLQKAKADPEIAPLFSKAGVLVCKDPKGRAPSGLEVEAVKRIAAEDIYRGASVQSYLTNSQFLPMDTCKVVARFLNRAINK